MRREAVRHSDGKFAQFSLNLVGDQNNSQFFFLFEGPKRNWICFTASFFIISRKSIVTTEVPQKDGGS